jgi:hypothetical protein
MKNQTNPNIEKKPESVTEVIHLPKALMPLGEHKFDRMEKTKTPRRHYFFEVLDEKKAFFRSDVSTLFQCCRIVCGSEPLNQGIEKKRVFHVLLEFPNGLLWTN